jgi:hypothetical protein
VLYYKNRGGATAPPIFTYKKRFYNERDFTKNPDEAFQDRWNRLPRTARFYD